jgi:hypothetical protein
LIWFLRAGEIRAARRTPARRTRLVDRREARFVRLRLTAISFLHRKKKKIKKLFLHFFIYPNLENYQTSDG